MQQTQIITHFPSSPSYICSYTLHVINSKTLSLLTLEFIDAAWNFSIVIMLHGGKHTDKEGILPAKEFLGTWMK